MTPMISSHPSPSLTYSYSPLGPRKSGMQLKLRSFGVENDDTRLFSFLRQVMSAHFRLLRLRVAIQ